MKLGVSLYSYQQSQFFKELDLEGQIREVGWNLPGADGIELIDEMSLSYPDPDEAFVERWFGWMEAYGTTPVTMDVSLDVLQFRDHVMTYAESADRLKDDIRLAHRLGFKNVRVLSTCPFEVMVAALPVAEELGLRLGKEVHQPMALEGQVVTEIIEYAQKQNSKFIGIVPDFGIFGTRPSEVLLAWYERRGAKAAASDAAVELAGLLRAGKGPFDLAEIAKQTAGNLRVAFKNFVATGECVEGLRHAFTALKSFADERIKAATELDYVVVSEAILLSNTSAETLRQLVPYVVNVHAKFNYMSEIPGHPGQYQDIAIDYLAAVAALKAGGYTGYLNSEYEGQRYFQDRTLAEMQSELNQVRRHQEMLRRLVAV